MSMNVSSSGSDEPMCDVNTTPLIDVMLVLLVMLIVTLPIQTHAVKLDMPIPNPNTTPPPPAEVIDLEIDFDGTIVWNGTPIDMATLDSQFRREAAKPVQPELHLRRGLHGYWSRVHVDPSAGASFHLEIRETIHCKHDFGQCWEQHRQCSHWRSSRCTADRHSGRVRRRQKRHQQRRSAIGRSDESELGVGSQLDQSQSSLE